MTEANSNCRNRPETSDDVYAQGAPKITSDHRDMAPSLQQEMAVQ